MVMRLLNATMLLFLTGAMSALAATDCVFLPDDDRSHERIALVEAMYSPECAEHHAEIASRLLALSIDKPHVFNGDSWPGTDETRFMAAFVLLREALWSRNRKTIDSEMQRARTELAAWERAINRRRLSAAGATDASDENRETIYHPGTLSLERIDEILAGAAPQPMTTVSAPEKNWILQVGWCGTPAFSFLLAARHIPGSADAWIARGEPRVALQALLIEQWVPAMTNGMVPPRLREFSDIAFGEGTLRKEVEQALAGIRLDETPIGTQAWLPMYGLSLPVPIGEHVWDNEHETRFHTSEQVAAYLRPRFEAFW